MVQGCASAHIIHNLSNLNSISISTSEETVTKQWDLHVLVITLNSENNCKLLNINLFKRTIPDISISWEQILIWFQYKLKDINEFKSFFKNE